MTVMLGVLIIIIVVLLMTGCVLLDSIEYEKHKNDEYYKRLRQEYDIQIQKYKHEVEEKDQQLQKYKRVLIKGVN